jgi:hypothetical protein
MGCLKAIVVRVGCLLVLLVLAALAYLYRREILDFWRHWRAGRSASAAWVAPGSEGAVPANRALVRLASRGGPAFVDLDAAAVAGLVEAQLERSRQRAFDSVMVLLGDDEVRVRGSVDLSRVPRKVLGPLRGAIHGRERVTVGGPLRADSAGRLMWRVRTLEVGAFPFPRSTIGAVLRAMNVPGLEDTELPLPVDARIGDVRVGPSAVRLYRAGPR